MADTAKKAALFLNNTLHKYNGIPVLLLVSGGSSRSILDFIDLSQYKNLTIGQLDDRIGPPEVRNWMPIVTLPVIQNISAEESGRDYDKKLHVWKKDHPDGKIVIIQGIGSDGHTAGMMIGFEKLFNGSAWAIGYDAGKLFKYRYRVTVTKTFLKNVVDTAIVYAVGKEKKNAIRNFTMYHAILFTDQ